MTSQLQIQTDDLLPAMDYNGCAITQRQWDKVVCLLREIKAVELVKEMHGFRHSYTDEWLKVIGEVLDEE